MPLEPDRSSPQSAAKPAHSGRAPHLGPGASSDAALYDLHAIVRATLAAIPIPPAGFALPEIHKHIADYAVGGTKRGVSQPEFQFIAACSKILGSRPHAIRQILHLAGHLGLLGASPQDWSDLEGTISKGSALSANRKRAALHVFEHFSSGLKDLPSWKSVIESAVHDSCTIRSVRLALRALGELQDQPEAHALVTAQLFRYAVRYRLAPDSIRVLVALCPSESSLTTQSLRAALIATEAHTERRKPVEPLRRMLDAVRAIERTGDVGATTLKRLQETLDSLSQNPPAQVWLAHQLFARYSAQRTNEIPELVDEYWKLVRSGVSVSYITPQVASRLLAVLESGKLPLERVLRLAAGISAFARRAHDPVDNDARNLSLHDVVDSLVDRPHSLRMLREERYFSKLLLILEGKYLDSRFQVSTIAELQQVVIELQSNALIFDACYEKRAERRRRLGTLILSKEVGYGDNPPFSLYATDADLQKRFMTQVSDLYRRQFQEYSGSGAYTFDFRHTPVSNRCIFDEFAARVGGALKVIPASGKAMFPGNGRLVEGLIPERVFAPHPDNMDGDPLHYWKSVLLEAYGPDPLSRRSGERHPLSNLRAGRILYLRGSRALAFPRDPFFTFRGEALTHLTYNEHLDASGLNMSFLVPSRAFWPLIDRHAVSYRPGIDPFPREVQDGGIAAHPPTPEMLRIRCHELKTSVGLINLGWGSNYGGGFCNAFEPEKGPSHLWESSLHRFRDAWGHSHKWYIKNEPLLLRELLDLHENIYSIARAFFNHWDVIHLVEGFDACGLTRSGDNRAQEPLEIDGPPLYRENIVEFDLEELTPEVDESSFVLHADGSDGRTEAWAEESRRMLDFASLFAFEGRAAALPKSTLPVLVLTSTTRLASAAASPFIFDTGSGIIWREKGSPLLLETLDGTTPPAIARWWDKEVAPLLLKDRSVRPRLLARDNYLTQMRALGAKLE